MKPYGLNRAMIGLLTLVALLGSAGAQAPTKQIRVGGNEAALEVKVSTSKLTYEVNESIVFRVIPNQDTYVYLFNIPDGSPTAIQLFPNQYEGGQPLVGNKEVTIPGKSTFRSDRLGREKVVLVASREPLTLSSTKALGEFATVAYDEVDALVKQIRIDPPPAPQRLVKQMEVVIRGTESPPASVPVVPPGRASRAAALITTDQIIYGASDRVTITYGADTTGRLAIYLLDPSKQVTLLKEGKVERHKTYKYRAQATPPTGEHVLLAVFNTKAKQAHRNEAFVTQLLTPERLGKDLRPLAEEPDGYAMYRFTTR